MDTLNTVTLNVVTLNAPLQLRRGATGDAPVGHIPSDGVYIEDTVHALYTIDDWRSGGSGKTPNALVVVSFPNAFRIALTQGGSMRISSSHTDAVDQYLPQFEIASEAIIDIDSAGNTANILKVQGSTEYAAGYCDAFVFPDGVTKGVLPALGWWNIAWKYKPRITECLSACGGTSMTDLPYKSSTFCGYLEETNRTMWVWRWNQIEDGSLDYQVSSNGLGSYHLVRPFAEYPLADTITIDQTDNDPFTRVGGDVAGDVITWIRSNSHRVLAKKTADGEVTYCRLDDTDSTKYHDGTTAALDGTEGDVFMKMPTFYYSGTEGDTVSITFSVNPYVGCVKWDGDTLIGAYEAYIANSKAYSRSGVMPTGYKTWGDLKTAAASKGTGYRLVDWQMHCVMGCLYYALYGNTNCQATVGAGTEYDLGDTGRSDASSMNDTVSGGSSDGKFVSFWGLENWWGNFYEYLHDYVMPADTTSVTVDDPVGGGQRTLPLPELTKSYYGYPAKMRFGRYLDLVAANEDDKATGSTGFCDYQSWPYGDAIEDRPLAVSGSYDNEVCGVAYNDCNYMSSDITDDVCSRIAFRGSCVEETDVEAFKAIVEAD